VNWGINRSFINVTVGSNTDLFQQNILSGEKFSMKTPMVSICFDDCWKSAITTAFPLLEKYKMTATFYATSDFIASGNEAYVNVADLKHIEERGHEIGSHTVSHPHLMELRDQDLDSEISGGVRGLRKHGFKPRSFAYPYGEWNARVVKWVRQTGFFTARSIERRNNNDRTNPMLLGAHGVRIEHTSDIVGTWIDEAIESKEWCILCFHQIEPKEILEANSWIFGTTPEVLEGILTHLAFTGVNVLTVTQGMEELIAQTLEAGLPIVVAA
jgi:peptidoglycan/xylan/chitin deacetylase (PgdA/CDA1 family)